MNSNDLIAVLEMTNGCPLACDYCYYFKDVVGSHKSRPVKMEKSVTQKLCDRITEFNEKKEISHVVFFLQGGEPLFIGKHHFVEMCDIIVNALKVPHSFHIQTNAVLIDKEWIEIFKEYKMRIGISIDGPEEYQNIHRKFKNGDGSFNIVDKNIRMCVDEGVDLGVLMVADPSFDPQKIWNYLVDDVGVKNIDTLLRKHDYDTAPPQEYVDAVSDYFAKWMDIWFARNDEAVRVRIFDSIVNALLGKFSPMDFSFNRKNSDNHSTIVVDTNGDLYQIMDKNIFKNNLEDIFSAKIFQELADARQNIPKDCDGCCWKYACHGGDSVLERFCSKNKFSNKSVYCKVWSRLFPMVASKLLKHGHPKEELLKVLSGEKNVLI